MEIDWENFFYECEHDPEINEHPLARNMECMYQAFKARLIEEVGVKEILELKECYSPSGECHTETTARIKLYDKSQEDN